MRVFVSPLDWGLGHAARCVPIIQYLTQKKIEVVIGSEGRHLLFLKEHCPEAEFINFPGYQISYSSILPVGLKVLLQVPKMLTAIKREHTLLSEIIKSKNIDAVISDNRYGLWNEEIPSVIITHQLNIQAAAGKKLFSTITQNYIRHFDECWIPDYEGEENLSGVLSHPIPRGINGKYMGPLSRFEPYKDVTKKNTYDLLAILSGPEPQRNKLEKLLLKELEKLPNVRAIIIQGLPGNKPKESGLKNVEIVPHLSDNELQDKINSSNILLSRPGYSTIMDIVTIGWRKAIFIPTPGQTEQEYLGKLMEKKGLALNRSQKRFSLKYALQKAKQINLVQPTYGKENYKEVLDEWLNNID